MNPPRPPVRPATRGPVVLLLELAFGLFFVTLFAWFIGIVIEVIGGYTIWKDEGVGHARRIVEQDLGYIAAAPRSLLVGDTVAFSERVLKMVEKPYALLGAAGWYQRFNGSQTTDATAPAKATKGSPLSKGLGNATRSMAKTASYILVISMYVAQDVLLRTAVAVFALPAFLLACLLGTIDGLVRRDLRRWGGGRESSFVYHHAKRWTVWSLTGGFGLYLSWPFGGFNPAYMVLVFTVLVAFTLSTTVAAFKKYA